MKTQQELFEGSQMSRTEAVQDGSVQTLLRLGL